MCTEIADLLERVTVPKTAYDFYISVVLNSTLLSRSASFQDFRLPDMSGLDLVLNSFRAPFAFHKGHLDIPLC